MQGKIFDLKQFAIHDGPGIRQTVFMKGCPLRCSWCHNPEGFTVAPQLMVSQGSCTHCGECSRVCPTPGCCTACGTCVSVCPQRVRRLVGEDISSKALADRLMVNARYYADAHGGVTFSGGEPLAQAPFVRETLAFLPNWMHKALETSGYGTEEAFAALCASFDLVMMDLKAMDDDVHKRYTGVSNKSILRNTMQLVEGDIPFVIRVPVIPGVNDNTAHMSAVAELVQGAKRLQRVELLPYHQTAGAKYTMLGMDYQMKIDETVPPHTFEALFQQYGIRSYTL